MNINKATAEQGIAFALEMLACASRQSDPTDFIAQLKAYANRNPSEIRDILNALKEAGLETTSAAPLTKAQKLARALTAKSSRAPQIGSLYDGKGVYVGDREITPTIFAPLYVAFDLERTAKGEQIQRTFNRQKDEFAKRNKGRTYGDGFITATAQAIVLKTYKEGDFFHGPLEFINGRDIKGNYVRDVNVSSLLQEGNPAFANILIDIENGVHCWVFSGTEHHSYKDYVHAVRLRDGDATIGTTTNHHSSGVLPFRAFGIKYG